MHRGKGEIAKEGKQWQAGDLLILCFFCHRFEPVRLVANADGRGSFSGEASGNSHNNIKNAFGEGLFYPWGQDPVAKTKPMLKKLSMKFGIVASETHDPLMKSIGNANI